MDIQILKKKAKKKKMWVQDEILLEIMAKSILNPGLKKKT